MSVASGCLWGSSIDAKGSWRKSIVKTHWPKNSMQRPSPEHKRRRLSLNSTLSGRESDWSLPRPPLQSLSWCLVSRQRAKLNLGRPFVKFPLHTDVVDSSHFPHSLNLTFMSSFSFISNASDQDSAPGLARPLASRQQHQQQSSTIAEKTQRTVTGLFKHIPSEAIQQSKLSHTLEALNKSMSKMDLPFTRTLSNTVRLERSFETLSSNRELVYTALCKDLEVLESL